MCMKFTRIKDTSLAVLDYNMHRERVNKNKDDFYRKYWKQTKMGIVYQRVQVIPSLMLLILEERKMSIISDNCRRTPHPQDKP